MTHEMDAEMKAFGERMNEAADPLKFKAGRTPIEWNSPGRAEKIIALIEAKRKATEGPPGLNAASPPVPTGAQVTGYQFPVKDEKVQRIMTNLRATGSRELSEILERLTYGTFPESGEHATYLHLRPTICAIGLLLNQRGEIAPRFRPIRKYRDFRNGPAREFSNDLQVLDLHWLSLHANVLPERGWKKLFKTDFDFVKASVFAKKVGSAENKATALGIVEQDQLLLSVIQSKATSDRWQTIKAGKREAEISLNDIAASKSSRLKRKDIPALCDEYVALRMGRGSPTAASEVLPFIAGVATSARAMQKRRTWFIDKGIAVD